MKIKFSPQGPRARCRQLESLSKRFEHHQKHDPDHENCRYFIDNAIEFLSMPVLIGAEVTHLERYYNVKLVKHPYRAWSNEERHP